MKWFEIILVVLTLGTGIISLLDKLFLAKRRAARAGLLDTEPPIIDYCRSFFPVLAAVLILRSFIAEPYKIPSSSMMPNLLIGDFIWSINLPMACACQSPTPKSFQSANRTVATWPYSNHHINLTRIGSNASLVYQEIASGSMATPCTSTANPLNTY